MSAKDRALDILCTHDCVGTCRGSNSCIDSKDLSIAIAEAQLEAVERYRKLLISQGNAVLMSVNYGGVLVPSYSERYVEELRKAAGK